MKPITFSCAATVDLRPGQIAQQILDVSQWPAFKGFAIIPGIKEAKFEVQTPEIVGSRIRVTNTDGSSHVEEIVEWEPSRRVTLHLKEFSAPLSRLATAFEETWAFQPIGSSTRVVRSFQLYAKSALARPMLWLIAFFLQKAIDRHLRHMRASISP